MPYGLLPIAALDAPDLATPQAVVEAFLAALMDGDVDAAIDLVDDDILYVNVGLPAVRGRAEVDRVMRLLSRPGAAFEVYLHAIAVDGATVLTERTDVLIFGRLRLQFWVWGRFDVRDGKIALWRDSFDFLDMTRGTVRALAALAIPSLRPAAPTRLEAPPGR